MTRSLRELVEALGLTLTDEQLRAFDQFTVALYEANAVMNLTRVPRSDCEVRHFLDSLLFQDLIPMGAQVLDIGTGPGFPAWPLACARPDVQVTALDSSGKALGFLRTQPLPNLEIWLGRAEEFPVRDKFDVVTGRAVAPLAELLEISARPCAIGGSVIPMRTPGEPFDGIKLTPLGLALREVVERPLDDTGVIRAFPIYVKEKRTAPKYPRRWAEIKKAPL